MPEMVNNYLQTETPETSINGETIPSIDQELVTFHSEDDTSNSQKINGSDTSHFNEKINRNIKSPQIEKDNEKVNRRHNFKFQIPDKINNYFKNDNVPNEHISNLQNHKTNDENENNFRHVIHDDHSNNNNTNNNNNDETNHRHHIGFNFNGTNTLMDDAHVNLNNLKYTLGERIRKVIYKIEDTFGPAIKKVIPNFIIAHYVYILFWVIIGSIIIYPAKNMEYVDALMYATGASTQGGLSTSQLNDMELYQQITVYVVCMFTTPIFIHGSLTFLRLYWYEKRFDNIKHRSIQQYKMRRTQTLANLRTETMHARTMTGTSTNRFQSYDSHNASEGLTSRMKRFENNMKNRSNELLSSDQRNDSHNNVTSKVNTPKIEEFDDNIIDKKLNHKNNTEDENHSKFENLNTKENFKKDSDLDYFSTSNHEKPNFSSKSISANDYFSHNHDETEHYSEPSDEISSNSVSNSPAMTHNRNNNKLPSQNVSEYNSDSVSDNESNSESENNDNVYADNQVVNKTQDGSEITGNEPKNLKTDSLYNNNTSSNLNLNNTSQIINSPNIKFGELPKPIKKKKKREIDPRDLFMSISVLQNNPDKNEDFESGPALRIKGPRERETAKEARRRKLPGHRLKHRKLLKERKLKKLKEKGKEMVENQRKLLDKELDELESEDLAFRLPKSFDIDKSNKDKKTKRSLSVPAMFAEKGILSPLKSTFDNDALSSDGDTDDDTDDDDDDDADDDDDETTPGNTINQISTNDRQINQNLKKMENIERSHTIHIPEFPKKILSTFETDFRKEFGKYSTKGKDNHNDDENNYDHDHDDGDCDSERSDGFDRKRPHQKRRPSFFTRTLTNMSRRKTYSDPLDMSDDELVDQYLTQIPTNYLSWKPTVGRNSKFITLSSDQKFELGGVEYQAMRLLSKLLVMYYVGFHIAGIIFFVPFADTKKDYIAALRADGVSPTWWAFFNSMSSFNDLGYSLNATSMVLFAQNAYVLIISAFLIVIGNTGFPIFLRLIIWILRLFTRPLTMTHDSLSFLLDHPRRCFTLLFPSGPTWWLTAVLVFLNAFDWILFIILDYGSSTLSYLPKGYQVLAGLFQSIATRTAGFNVVNLATLHPAIQVSYMVMMYISVLPIAISVRRTNVYEEQSLGVYNRDEEAEAEAAPKLKYIGTHLRKQLSFDLWFLFLAIFIICIVEGGRIRKGDVNFGIFQIMFEVTSAYGTVGLSLGYPTSNASFSGQFTKLSKLVIIATLIRGRHRGLPNSIDRAIMLSDQNLNLRDDLEAYHAMRRNNTVVSDDVDSLFPSITRAATRASRNNVINRQPTISENLKNGVIPFKSIAHGAVKTLGKIASNVLTVSGTPVDKYSRQLTQYNTYDIPYRTRTKSTTYSDYNRTLGSVNEGDEYEDDDNDEEDDDDYIEGHHNTYAESIPLYNVRGNRGIRKKSVASSHKTYSDNKHNTMDDNRNLHTMFVDHMNEGNSGRGNKNVRLQEGSSHGESNVSGSPIHHKYDNLVKRASEVSRYRPNETEVVHGDDDNDDNDDNDNYKDGRGEREGGDSS